LAAPAYDAIFDPYMVEVLAAEAGKVEGPRYDDGDAIMKVAATERGRCLHDRSVEGRGR
jgi:hypothetical protein